MYKKLFILLLLYISLIVDSTAQEANLAFMLANQYDVRQEEDMWQRLRNGFKLNHKETKEVKYWEKYYANSKFFAKVQENASPYLFYILNEIERRGLPSELALIPIIESLYKPWSISSDGASTGIWQFVTLSAERFGLKQENGIDERLNIISSTQAALTYLEYLRRVFANWELAIAAYNFGEGNIYNAYLEVKGDDFYKLKVREVTKAYVPKLIALANIIENPSRFGVKLKPFNNAPYFFIYKTSPLESSQNIDQVDNIELLKLNPQYKDKDITNYLYTLKSLLIPVKVEHKFFGIKDHIEPATELKESAEVEASPQESQDLENLISSFSKESSLESPKAEPLN